jgi:hypothetical protein
MKPDFGDIIARGIVAGVVGVLSQPLVIVTLVLMLGVAIVMRRIRRRRRRTRPGRRGRS